MAKMKKFGTMGGVYTPSVLTILGVIMYMRLSWVAGNAGTLLGALLIIVLAHIISVTTGLSLSSIATDKKIKGGGLYYMLSRSLGFPIGGAIGVTLYVATALSIALYLIGFAESALVVVDDWFGITEITITHLRIAGTLALVFIVTIAYISTSIAIKTQYVILSLIALSLVSVFAGTSVGKGFDVTPISGASDVDFSTLFGIFFPAVTGFTAGVAMSGDLKKPKKSIPWGTLLAILTGMLIYVALTVFVYYKIPLAELQKNTNVLLEFAWIPEFVIAGIWGATLSSALGGILGAPRILQAMSADRITPRFLAKGVGKNNEPRQAILLTFVLAELGILIGELDVIAGITAMFYMAAYLFINVSCFLEQWASPDFRPTFRIPLLVSLVGTVATFLLMIQLDIVAALVSVVVMALIFLWLTRKQLELGSGDVWQSVWSSVVKLGLKKLSKKQTHERNWEPNILLFSGGTDTRPHLLEFSKSIAGRNGMISNFDLIENVSAKTLFPKSQQNLKVEGDDDDSIFYRRQECKHLYEGIETIAQTYGFSGVEPNTVLLGWVHNTKQPSGFIKMTNALHELDYNVLFLDYDERKGFGKKEKIDIWWQDLSQMNYLTVQLTKFLLSSKDWREATVRFIYLNNTNSAQHAIRKALESITRELRDLVSVEIVNNELEQKSFYDVVRVVSAETDLILMNLPDLSADNEEHFIADTNAMLKEMGTTLLMRTSSQFDKRQVVDLELEKEYSTITNSLNGMDDLKIQPLAKTSFLPLQETVAEFDKRLKDADESFIEAIFAPLEKIFAVLESHITSHKKLNAAFYKDMQVVLSDVQDNRLHFAKKALNEAIFQHEKEVKRTVNQLKSQLKWVISREQLEQDKTDSLRVQNLKAKLRSNRKENRVKVHPKKTAQQLCEKHYKICFAEELHNFGTLFYELNVVLKRWLSDWESEQISEKELLQNVKKVLNSVLLASKQHLSENLYTLSRRLSNSILAENDRLIEVKDSFAFMQDVIPTKTEIEPATYAQDWVNNSRRLLNQLKVNFELVRFKQNVLPQISEVYTNLSSEYLSRIAMLVEQLQKIEKERCVLDSKEITNLENDLLVLGYEVHKEQILTKLEKRTDAFVQKLPQEMEVIGFKNLTTFDYQQIDVDSEWIDIKRVVAYLSDSNVIHSLDQLLQQNFLEVQSEQLKVENILKLLQFEIATEEKLKQNSKEISSKISSELKDVSERLQTADERLEKGVQYIRSQANELFTDETIWVKAQQLNGIIRKEKRRKGIVEYANKVTSLPIKLYHKADDLLTQGKDMVLQSSLQQRYKEFENPHAKWRNFVSRVSVSKENQEAIPFYYQQLFLGKHKAPFETLKCRANEIAQFDKAYEYFQGGTSGAILLTGELYSGTSYLIENIINTYAFDNILHLPTPRFLYTDPRMTLDRSFRIGTGSKNDMETCLKNLMRGTVIIIEDLELWWYRSEKGLGALREILNLIRNYSEKYLFVLSCNTEFFKLIRKLLPIDDYLQETITMQPLRTEQMEEVIWERHKASGISLEWKGIVQKDLTSKMRKEILWKITNISQGNLGFAFTLWLSSIEKMENGKIILNDILNEQLPEVERPEWTAMLQQFVLHKQIRKRNLFEIYEGQEKSEVEANLESLLRIGIIQQQNTNVFEISPFAMLYVVKHLRTKKLID